MDAVEDVTHPFMTKIIGTIQASHQLGEDAFLLLGTVQQNSIPLSCQCDLRSGDHSSFSGNHYSSITKLSGSSTSRPNIFSFGEKPVDSCTEEGCAIISKGRYRSQSWFNPIQSWIPIQLLVLIDKFGKHGLEHLVQLFNHTIELRA